jgi:hypothetical protein
MVHSAQHLQDFIVLAQTTLGQHGVVTGDAALQSAGKMLQRLADPLPAPQGADSSLTHEAMLQRCASHDIA